MKFTAEDLDSLSNGLVCLVPRDGVGGITSHEYSKRLCDCTMLELIRLSRLGLWVNEHRSAIVTCLNQWSVDYHDVPAHNALAALPAEKDGG